jgi:hypothetical protein
VRVRSSAPSRVFYIVPLLLLVAAGWFAFGRDFVSANVLEPKTDQNDKRRFRDVGDGTVEDMATGLRRPIIDGQALSAAFPEKSEPTADDLRNGRGARPIHVSVRAIGLEADVIPIGLDENRAIAVPERADIAGWWSGGYAAGERGPTVLVGHYDSKVAPGIFEELKKVGPGARVIVEQSDGSVFLYDVVRVEKVPKSEFPTEAVYGPTPASSLRLITCGGEFDNATRHYVDNTIVYADLVVPATSELRADRPITKVSELPPTFVAEGPAGVDGGAGVLVGPSTPPAESTVPADATSTETATSTTVLTPLAGPGGVASTSTVATSAAATVLPAGAGSVPPASPTTRPPSAPTIAPGSPTAPPATVAGEPTTQSAPSAPTTAPTTTAPTAPTVPTTAAPTTSPSVGVVPASTIAPESTIPVATVPVEAGSPPATSVVAGA